MIYYLASSGVNLLLPLLLLPVLARWLSPADFGIIALGTTAGMFLRGLANLGVSTAMERNFFKYERDPDRLGAMLYSGLLLVGLSTFLFGGIAYAAREWISWMLAGEKRWAFLFWIISLASALRIPIEMHLYYLRNSERARSFMLYSVCGNGFENILCACLVISGGMGAWGIVWGQLISRTLLLGVVAVYFMRHFPRVSFNRKMAEEHLRIGLPLVPRLSVAWLDKSVDRTLIAWLNSFSQVGLFGIASSIGYGVFEILNSVQNVYTPQVYRLMFEKRPDAGTRIGRLLTPYCYLSLAAPILIVLWIEEAVRILMTPAFHGLAFPAAVITAYYGQMFFGKITGIQLLYKKKVGYIIPLGVLRTALHIGFAFWFVRHWGAVGAAWALFISGFLSDAVCMRVAHLVYPIRYETGYVVRILLLLYAALALAALSSTRALAYPVLVYTKCLLMAVLIGHGIPWIPRVRNLLLPEPRKAMAL